MHRPLFSVASATLLLLLLLLSLIHQALAGYNLVDNYNASNWLASFEFQTMPDPTGGYVNYLASAAARASGLFNTTTGAVYMGVDHTTTDPPPPGRASIRLRSKKSYTRALLVLSLTHMPASLCGTWPAFWTTNEHADNWPAYGEIDIVEGVNRQTGNLMTLHTGPGCAVDGDPALVAPEARLLHADCDIHSPTQPADVGCAFNDTRPASFGSAFNAGGGGVFALEWASTHIAAWFFPHAAAPSDAVTGVAGSAPEPASWGKPAALFQGRCDIDSSFKEHNVIFDNTFCGSWAGKTDWVLSGCAAQHGGSCEAHVARMGGGFFAESYWEVQSLKVFQTDGKPPAPAAPAAASSSAAPPPRNSALPPAVKPSAPPSTLSVVPPVRPTSGAASAVPLPPTTTEEIVVVVTKNAAVAVSPTTTSMVVVLVTVTADTPETTPVPVTITGGVGEAGGIFRRRRRF